MTAAPDKKMPVRPDPSRLREICREVGGSFPARPSGAWLVLTASHPRLGYVSWSVEEAAVAALATRLGERFAGARFVIRLYDVTDILFDGLNAHSSFDVDIQGSAGNYYLPIEQGDRNLLAEVGYLLGDGAFFALARSQPRWFDRDRPTNNYQLGGLFVSSALTEVVVVESVLDAPSFERLNTELKGIARTRPLRIASVDAGLGAVLTTLVRRLGSALSKLAADVRVFADDSAPGDPSDVVAEAQRRSAKLYLALEAAHGEQPFDIVHCHEWYSVPAALRAGGLGIPLVVSLHSTEYERTGGVLGSPTSQAIAEWEREGVDVASLVVVPREATRQVLIEHYGARPERVTVVADVELGPAVEFPGPEAAKRRLGLDPSCPVALFAGELSHAAGADLVLDAVPTVCRENPHVQFVFAGDGPLRGELEARAYGAGFAHRVRFLGDVAGDRFEAVLLAADFIVIPARTWQEESLAKLAISYGRPVLTTRQANLYCVQHGQNGLVTYDNPGSIVWGVKELLANPLRGSMLRLVARRRASHGPTFDRMTAEHRLVYEGLVRERAEASDA